MKRFFISLLPLLAASAIYAQVPVEKPVENSSDGFGSGSNLLKNGNFADGTEGWEFFNWGKNSRMEMDEQERFEGKPTLRVENLEPCHTYVRQIVQGKPNTEYRLTGYVKTEDVRSAESQQESGAVFEIGTRGIYTPLINGTKPWRKVTVDFTTTATGEIRVGPSLGTDPAFVSGRAWFAHLSLAERKANLLTNGNFEEGTKGWDFFNWGKISKMEIDEDERYEGKPTLRVENYDSCHSYVRQIIQAKPNTRYRLTGYIKTGRIVPATPGQRVGAVLEIGTRGIYTAPLMEKHRPWTKVTVDFSTTESGEIRAGPSLGTPTFMSGEAWFADLSLVELNGNDK